MTGPVPAPRRVAFFGNVANAPFRAVLALRDRGVEAELFVSSTDGPTSRPENVDPTLAVTRPPWIHDGDWISPSTLLAPWRAPIVRRLAEYDAVVASGPAPVFAQFAGRPWAFYVTGGDLTVKPFPVTFWRHYPNWPHRAAEVVAGSWQRRAIRRADQLWTQPFAPMLDAMDRLGVPERARSGRYVPMTVDTDRYRADGDLPAEALAYVDEVLPPGPFVALHPSRLVMEPTPLQVRTGQWKGNDTLIEGFATFVRSTGADALLALIDSPLSKDVATARRLVADLGIEDHVRWLVPPGGRSFDHEHMVALYRRADVVMGEIGVGWFGYTALEGAAMGRPVINRIDEVGMAQLYASHPFLSADDPAGVAEVLTRLAASPAERETIGAASREWALAHHGHDAAADALEAGVASLLS